LQTKEDKLKGIEILRRSFMQDIEHFIPIDDNQHAFKAKIKAWKDRIQEMQRNKHKIELESFFNEMPPEWI